MGFAGGDTWETCLGAPAGSSLFCPTAGPEMAPTHPGLPTSLRLALASLPHLEEGARAYDL